MVASAASYGRARYQAGEDDYQIVPKLDPLRTGRGVLFCHGAGGNADDGCTSTLTGTFPLIQALGKRFPVLGPDLGGITTWGNATVQTRCETARAFMGSAMGAVNDKVHLLGISMGALSCFQYARANPSKVKSIALVIGAVDIDFCYQNNIAGARAQIEAAWGVAFPASLPGGALIINDAASWDGIPVKAWYVTDDIFTPTASIEAFADSISTGSRVNLGALGHTEAAVAAVAPQDVIDFFTANDA